VSTYLTQGNEKEEKKNEKKTGLVSGGGGDAMCRLISLKGTNRKRKKTKKRLDNSDGEVCVVMCRFDLGQANGLEGQDKKKKKERRQRRVYRQWELDAVQCVISISINGMNRIGKTKTRTEEEGAQLSVAFVLLTEAIEKR
jgi:hypothetical protein